MTASKAPTKTVKQLSMQCRDISTKTVVIKRQS